MQGVWNVDLFCILIILVLPVYEFCPVLRFMAVFPVACDRSLRGSSLDECFAHQFYRCATFHPPSKTTNITE